MYLAKDKNTYVSDAVSLIIWGMFNPNRTYNDFYSVSDSEGLHPLKNSERNAIQIPEGFFGDWKDTIQVYRSTPVDGDDRPIDFEDDWLGMYTPMNSKGSIDLFLYRIRDCFNQLTREMISPGYPITQTDFVNMARIFIRQIVYHEYFHHYADVQRQLHDSYYARNLEEALAVAWSRIQIEEYCTRYLRIPLGTPLYEVYKRKLFNYSQPGYRDWVYYYTPNSHSPKYDIQSLFCEGVRKYTVPSSSSRLISNGFSFDTLILSDLDVVYNTSDAVTLHLKLL